MKYVLSLVLALLFAGNATANTPADMAEMKVDVEKSNVEWVGRKVTGKHNGSIDIKMGKLEMKEGTLSGGHFVIDMTTIVNFDLEDPDTNKKLVNHLNSDDFFSVASYPTSEFKITHVSMEDDGSYRVRGDLTVKGKTHPVEFPAKVEMKDGMMMAEAEINVDRAKYDVRYGSGSFFKGLGDNLIYDDFTLKVNLVASN
jgi:polyisoprenoid-binding protein YceI